MAPRKRTDAELRRMAREILENLRPECLSASVQSTISVLH